jgi:hypothetical protein
LFEQPGILGRLNEAGRKLRVVRYVGVKEAGCNKTGRQLDGRRLADRIAAAFAGKSYGRDRTLPDP